jgi:hypothetical protein
MLVQRLLPAVQSFVGLVFCCSCAGPARAPSEAPPRTTSLVAHYPFDGDTLDKTGNRNDGDFSPTPVFVEDRCYRPSSALAFDGRASKLQLRDPSGLLKMSEGFTVLLWVKSTTFAPAYQNLISDHAPNETSAGPGKILRLAGSDVQFIVGGVYGHGTGIFAHRILAPTDVNRWVQLVGTYDRKTLRLFVDGVPADSKPYSEAIARNPNPMLVGMSGYGEPFAGAIDDLMIYDGALSADEVQAQFSRGVCPSPAK